MKDKPFALIGVNVNKHQPAELKEIMSKENLNWRSFADLGGITRQWNSPPTPTYFLIDTVGTIRHKWVGSPGKKVMDDALQELLQEVEELNKRADLIKRDIPISPS